MARALSREEILGQIHSAAKEALRGAIDMSGDADVPPHLRLKACTEILDRSERLEIWEDYLRGVDRDNRFYVTICE